MRRIPFILTVAMTLLLCSCDKSIKVDENFLKSEDLCLIEKGKTVHTFDARTWQIGYSAAKKQFRIHNDTMSEYYILTLGKIPSKEGETVTGSLVWTNSTGVSTPHSDLSFNVEKMDGAGRIWLWCKSKRIAVSVQIPK